MSLALLHVQTWLAHALKPAAPSFCAAHIFGSVALRSPEPNDCDIVVVARVQPTSKEWLALRILIEHMRNGFINEFGLPLSVTLLTTNEWCELSDFFTDKSVPVPMTGANMRIETALSRAGFARSLRAAHVRR
jgi:hypothetical protein